MSLFREQRFDSKSEADHAHARISGRIGRHNVQLSNYAVPLLGALLAILFTIYGLTRPSVADKLRQPTAPHSLEIDLE